MTTIKLTKAQSTMYASDDDFRQVTKKAIWARARVQGGIVELHDSTGVVLEIVEVTE